MDVAIVQDNPMPPILQKREGYKVSGHSASSQLVAVKILSMRDRIDSLFRRGVVALELLCSRTENWRRNPWLGEQRLSIAALLHAEPSSLLELLVFIKEGCKDFAPGYVSAPNSKL
mmetsp:Transcript_17706/g.27392  ORF Transcript_17706/g.27392 Transcript_17706/m.27392 type:complete len:116 (-) Transcript_17706:941-1288(-)